jgi:DNA-binding CsgD family transcriptional regulator
MSITPLRSRSSISALTPKYARLQTVLETSARTVERGAGTRRADVVELQRRAISSLQECADVALSLAECLGDGLCPREAACLHLGDWNRCNACFNAQLSRFLDQASKFMNAVMVNPKPGPIIAPKAKEQRPTAFDAFSERAATFTEAQHRVFELLITGLPNKLIAYEIGVSEATVKAHVSAVLRKLQVRSRAQAIALSSAFERNNHNGASSAQACLPDLGKVDIHSA